MSQEAKPEAGFDGLGLSEPVLAALEEVGYEIPSPIQSATIPVALTGQDLVGQAQTGTGKTAAFALPILSKIDVQRREPQALVLVPTRELAIQVSEAFGRYGKRLRGFRTLAVYGGQNYDLQRRPLRQGVHVVVGTPGRIMDLMRKRVLDVGRISTLVLDEADEMLKMGFIEDVDWILDKTPKDRQTALFSATMPDSVRGIANRHLRDPQEVSVAVKLETAAGVRQRYWFVKGIHKLDALTRLLELEDFDAVLVFVRTKHATVELAEQLFFRGFTCAPLNGDIPQKTREKTLRRLKRRKLDIIIATDVAARGIDVDRISHVINYDAPYDIESYVHRIGRTGRAGRKGDAILFVSPREARLLRGIQEAVGRKVEELALPSVAEVNARRTKRFKKRISKVLEMEELSFFRGVVEEMCDEGHAMADVAAALGHMAQGARPLLLTDEIPSNVRPTHRELKGRRDETSPKERRPRERAPRDHDPRPRDTRNPDARNPDARKPDARKPAPRDRAQREQETQERRSGMARYRIEVGRRDNVRPGDIVGAIANETGLDREFIGRIAIHDDHTMINLPADMPRKIFEKLHRVKVRRKPMRISKEK